MNCAGRGGRFALTPLTSLRRLALGRVVLCGGILGIGMTISDFGFLRGLGFPLDLLRFPK